VQPHDLYRHAPVTTDSRTWIAARIEREKRQFLTRTQGGLLARALVAVENAAWGLAHYDEARDWLIAIALLASVFAWSC